MLIQRLFPSIQIAVCLCASFVYGWKGDAGRAAYWAAAALLTTAVTYWIK